MSNVLLKYPLFRRSTCTNLGLPPTSFLSKGSYQEVEDKIYFGIPLYCEELDRFINTWYKLKNSEHFIWTGGTSSPVVSEEEQFKITKYQDDFRDDAFYQRLKYNHRVMNWGIQKQNILEFWRRGYRGKGVKIAILDTGVDEELFSWIDPQNIYSRFKSKYDESNEKHGTKCASIIGGRGISHYGIAPESELIICKISKRTRFTPNRLLGKMIEGLEWLWNEKNEVDVISLSVSIDLEIEKEYKDIPRRLAEFKSKVQIVKGLLQKFYEEKNTIIVAACGNVEKEGFKIKESIFPAKEKFVISVGACNRLDGIHPSNTQGPNLDILAPGENLYTPKGNFDKSSAACAFTAGTIGLLKQKYPEKSNNDLIDELRNSALINRKSQNNRDNTRGYGILNAPSFLSGYSITIA